MVANWQYITNEKRWNSKSAAINVSVDDVRNELGTSAPLSVNVAKLIVRTSDQLLTVSWHFV